MPRKDWSQPCGVEGCPNPRDYREFCGMHYSRVKRGRGVGPAERLWREPGQICSAEGCEDLGPEAGMCKKHRQQLRRRSPRQRPYEVRKAVVSNSTVHRRLKEIRGLARQFMCPCGSVAQHWAYNHSGIQEFASGRGAYSLDLDQYDPLCVKCHKALDSKEAATN